MVDPRGLTEPIGYVIAQADMDVESFEEGFLAKIVFGDGASAPVGATVALLAKTKEVRNSKVERSNHSEDCSKH